MIDGISISICRIIGWFRPRDTGDLDAFFAGAQYAFPGAQSNPGQKCCAISSPFGGVNCYQFAFKDICQDLAPQGTLGASTPKRGFGGSFPTLLPG